MAVGDLCTLATAKTWLGITTSAQDAALGRQITVFSRVITDYLARPIARATVTERRSGHGGTTLVLHNYPILSVTSVTIDGVAVPASSTPGATGYWYGEQAIDLAGYSFARGRENVVIVLTAGYASVPGPVEQALLTCLQGVQGQQQRDPNITGESVPGVYSASYAGTGTGRQAIPPLAVELLEPYRRRFS